MVNVERKGCAVLFISKKVDRVPLKTKVECSDTDQSVQVVLV